MTTPAFHLLDATAEPPAKLNNPFCYEPHELTLLAARRLCSRLPLLSGCEAEIEAGKMFGVLVCSDGEGRLGFLAAYSGQLGGRADWPWFVPAVFDYLQPDGHFMQEDASISAINAEVMALEQSEGYQELTAELRRVKAEGEAAVGCYREMMQESKRRRDALRQTADHDEAALIAESQHQKAELRRIRKHWQEEVGRVGERLRPTAERIESLRRQRRQRSDELQRWLFDNFVLLNSRGESRSLTSIFATTPQGTPPSGAGECCAPKLLHHAFRHHLRPLCMGEFWQGRSPQMEIRHHGQFYPACRGKCKPILEWMLDIKAEDADSSEENVHEEMLGAPLYIDEHIIVVSKPSGLLSVPGRKSQPSVESILSDRYGRVFMPHRLDQDTSGLIVAARTMDAYRNLQRQFLERTVKKEYEALLVGDRWEVGGIASESQHTGKASVERSQKPLSGEGLITLPLRPDLDDRPRQLVDHEHGKAASTSYYIKNVENGQTRVVLVPHTGRTHQLRVHCAHHEGLGMPIVGDTLYGLKPDSRGLAKGLSLQNGNARLCLHARFLAFRHPATGQELRFEAETQF